MLIILVVSWIKNNSPDKSLSLLFWFSQLVFRIPLLRESTIIPCVVQLGTLTACLILIFAFVQ